jgi:hypothetical protein
METRFEKERNDFECYLIDTYGYSKKVAKDCMSRCKRIETHISSDLSKSVSNVKEFENLIIQIQQYSSSICDQKESAYSLTGSLRAAAKKYALYLFPQKAASSPTAHGKSTYR